VSALSDQRPGVKPIISALRAPIETLHDIASEIFRSVWPASENAWLTTAELQLTRRTTRFGVPVLILASIVVEQACSPWVPFERRFAWCVTFICTAVFLYCAAQILEAQPREDRAGARFRAVWRSAFAVLIQFTWCSMGLWLRAHDAPIDHLLLAFVLAASMAGGVSVCATHPATAAAIIVAHGLFLILPNALSSAPLDHTLALLDAALVLMMTVQAGALHHSIAKMLTLEHERCGIVDELRHAKQESDHERTRATTAGRAKTQFLSNMNHELRTPMNAILGFSELIKYKSFGGDIDKYSEYADIIHQSGLHLLRLIDDMLDLAKIEGGKLGLRETELSLANSMSDVFDEYASKADSSQLSFLKKVQPGLPQIFADERAIRQILANLVSNAIKFTPAGGCVTLFAQAEADGRIAFGVDDTGIGIAEENQARVFERFGQGRHDVTSADKGTGLGLAIVKGFAEAHDGEVKLESTLGAGTRLTVYLPAERVRPVEHRLAS